MANATSVLGSTEATTPTFDPAHENRVRDRLRNMRISPLNLRDDTYDGLPDGVVTYVKPRGVTAEIALLSDEAFGVTRYQAIKAGEDLPEPPTGKWSKRTHDLAIEHGGVLMTYVRNDGTPFNAQFRLPSAVSIPTGRRDDNGDLIIESYYEVEVGDKGGEKVVEKNRPETKEVRFAFPTGSDRGFDALHCDSNAEIILVCEGMPKGDNLAGLMNDSRVGILISPGVDAVYLGKRNDENPSDYLPLVHPKIEDAIGGSVAGKTILWMVDSDAWANEGVRGAMSRGGQALTAAGAHFGVLVAPTSIEWYMTDQVTGKVAQMEHVMPKKSGWDDWAVVCQGLLGRVPLNDYLAAYVDHAEWAHAVKQYTRDDAGRAKRLADELVHRHYKIVPGHDNMYWNGHRYRPDEDEVVLKAIAIEVAERDWLMNGDLTRTSIDKFGNVKTTVTKEVRSTRVIADMRALAVNDPRLIAEPGDFDQFPWTLIPFRNGMYNATERAMGMHDPAHMNTYIVETDYMPGALNQSTLVQNFINATFIKHKRDADGALIYDAKGKAVMVPDAELARQVRMQVATALVRRTFEIFCVWKGRGQDGKSTLTLAIQEALGEQVTDIMDADVMVGKQRDKFSLAITRGKLAVFTSEPNEQAEFDDGFAKTMASHDKMTSQEKFGKAQKHKPTHTIFMPTNPWPKLVFSAATVEDRKGFWRRMHVVEFLNSMTEEDPRFDGNLNEKMAAKEQREALIDWAMHGLFDLMDRDLRFYVSPASQESKSTWQADTDALGLFVIECLEQRPEPTTDVEAKDLRDPRNVFFGKDLHTLYERHCMVNHRKPLGRNKFLSAMEKRLGDRVRITNKECWVGWKITPEWAGEWKHIHDAF